MTDGADAAGGGDESDGIGIGSTASEHRILDLFAGHDFVLFATTMAGIYLLFVLLAFFSGVDNWVNLAMTFIGRVTVFVAAYAILVLALNIHWGYTGLFNIGVAGFMAVGAYTMAILTAPVDPGVGVAGFGLPVWVGFIGGMIAAAIVGAITALPALRLKADYLAIVTVALSEIIRLLVNSESLQEVTVLGKTFGTGGGTGLSFRASGPKTITNGLLETVGGPLMTAAENASIRTTNIETLVYGLFMLLIAGLVYFVLARTVNSPFGRVLKAIREDELVARSLGKDTRTFKIKAFMLGCALMGLGGILFRGEPGYVSPTQFLPNITFFVFIALIIGGAGSNTGSVLGGTVFSVLLFYLPQQVTQNLLLGDIRTANDVAAGFDALLGGQIEPLIGYAVANLAQLRFVFIGVLLIFLVQRRPDGLLGHRNEPAASVDIRERPGPTAGSTSGDVATDGGVRDDE